MCDVTKILDQIESGDAGAADKLLPLVYDELRKLAWNRMSRESPDQTLQATALVHEAYLRLVGNGQTWKNRGHFFWGCVRGDAEDSGRECAEKEYGKKGR